MAMPPSRATTSGRALSDNCTVATFSATALPARALWRSILRGAPPSAPPRVVRATAAPRGSAAAGEAAASVEVRPPRRVKRVLTASSSGAVDYGPKNLAELEALAEMLPPPLRDVLRAHPEYAETVEVVLDVGRLPVARFPSGDAKLAGEVVTYADVDGIVETVGEFGGDNRAGIDRCLHRISCMRNRAGRVVGLTCRVGRVVPGTAELVGDILRMGGSVLLLGCPGVGKTTALRDICRLLSEESNKRVVVVDTSNEIGGDGDIPHYAVGRARRLQVPNPERQHAVMIEAVENHMPEVIVIDEIGTEAEALAARTIAERGVQLVATCHGNQLENVLRNPSLNELVGGVQSVTLGDEGARLRGGKKTVIERRGPPTFSAVVEMTARLRWVVHHDAGRAVDMLLAGLHPAGEVREMTAGGEVTMAEHWQAERDAALAVAAKEAVLPGGGGGLDDGAEAPPPPAGVSALLAAMNDVPEGDVGREVSEDAIRLYCLGIEGGELVKGAVALGLGPEVSIAEDLEEADAVVTTRAKVKANGWIKTAAAVAGVPVFSLKAASEMAITRALRQILGVDPSPGGALRGGAAAAAAAAADPAAAASQRSLDVSSSTQQVWGTAELMALQAEAEEEVRTAIEQIVIPRNQPIELLPRVPALLELQAAVALEYGLRHELSGDGPAARLRILPALLDNPQPIP
eukprot:jgi/Tetstr1/423300/TSEL_013999.t1